MDDSLERDDAETRVIRNPRPAQLLALGCTTLSFLLCLGLTAAGLNWPTLWVVPLLIGLAGAATATAIAPKSPGNLVWAGAAAVLAFFVALRSGWDTSVPFLFGTLAVLALVAAGLMLMPRLVRRVA